MTSPELSLPRMPARAPSAGGARPATLRQCLLLALLLHVWLVVLLGSTPGGSARPGEGVWGPLNITLQGVASEGGDAAVSVPNVPTGPAGDATAQRFGGAVRDAEAPAARRLSPGAARLGRWQPSANAPGVRAPAPATLPGTESMPTPAPLPAPTPTDAAEPTPEPEPVAPVRAAAPAPPSLAPLQPVAPHFTPRLDSPAPLIAPEPTPALPPATPAPPTPTPIDRATAVAPAPIAPVTPWPLPPIDRRLPLPGNISVNPQVEPPAVPPAPMPAPSPAPVAPQAPSPPAPTPVPTPTPVTAHAAIAAPTPSTAPTPPNSTAPPATNTAAPAPARVASPVRATSQAETGLDGRPTASPSATHTSPGGAPDAGSTVGHDIATAPSASASAPAPLDLRLPSLRGGEISRQVSPGLFQMLPHPPEQKSKLANDIDKAAQPDCRTAYADKGLIAVAPLVADAVKGTGCRW